MIDLLIGPLRGAVGVALANDSSKQIAAGVAIGVVLGFLPKATLLAVLFGVLLCALKVNKAAGLMAAAAVSSLAPLTDAFTHRLGLKILTAPSLQPTFSTIYDAPLGPWWGLQNTVVCGSLLLGLYLSYPTYLVTRGLVDRIRPRVVRWILKYKLGRVLFGAQITTRLGATLGAGS